LAEDNVERLWQARPPWMVASGGSSGRAYELAWHLQEKGAVARVLRGSKMTTLDGFFTEVGAALQFPAYFGENWDALDECLTDLLWLRGPAYTLIVTDAHLLFRDEEPDPLPTFVRVAESTGKAWATAQDRDKPWGHGRVPFHIVLQIPEDARKQWAARLAASGLAVPWSEFEIPGRP
jgi:hypothetical protein